MFGGAILFFGAVSISIKCTVAGYHLGINCYIFRYYRNKCVYWEKLPKLDICDMFFTFGLTINGLPRNYMLRFVFSNFDKLAELISCNTRIKLEIRQKFIDYVTMRKQQGALKRMMRIVYVNAVMVLIIYLLSFILGAKCLIPRIQFW
jgi:hypothetical protein